jgi:hypothetical protein
LDEIPIIRRPDVETIADMAWIGKTRCVGNPEM